MDDTDSTDFFGQNCENLQASMSLNYLQKGMSGG